MAQSRNSDPQDQAHLGVVVALYVLDEQGRPRPAASYEEWAAANETADQRRIAHTVLPSGAVVSTIFTGIDHGTSGHPPLLFETAVRRPLDDVASAERGSRRGHSAWQPVARWSTRDEAIAGHKHIVAEPTWFGGDHGD